MTDYVEIPSPIGPLLLTGDGAALTGLYMLGHQGGPAIAADWQEDPQRFRDAIAQLQQYFAGSRRVFDLPLQPHGTPFQQEVWQALQQIPFGQTLSYGGLAARLGKPNASRAVGLANGRNPLSIVVPCHRVIGADGSLTGYGGGMARKAWLLAHEHGRPLPPLQDAQIQLF
jgi:methylated-DNA-[protein]-cysteine S-methyltransferase